MYPKICSLGPITVYSYGAVLAIAFIVAVALACSEAKRRGIDPDFIFNLSFTVLVFGIIGARLFYVFSNLGYYLKNPLEIIMLPMGMSWFGGFFLGLAFRSYFIKRKKKGFIGY